MFLKHTVKGFNLKPKWDGLDKNCNYNYVPLRRDFLILSFNESSISGHFRQIDIHLECA